MGDASQAKSTNRSRFRSQVIVEGQQNLPPETQPPDTGGLPVLYTHAENDQGLSNVPNGQYVCRSLEELLSYLESELVESLWFDETVSAQERNYIVGWARIFRPDVAAHRIIEKIAN